MIRLAFFDMDGTLCAPRFYVNGKMVGGMSDEAWHTFCEKNGEDTYRFCKPVPSVTEYARKLRECGAKVYVLSTSQTKYECDAKNKFVRQNYPAGFFTEVLTVEHDADKLPVIREIAEKEGVRPEECELIEDTYATVLAAIVAGIRGTHVSMIYCDAE
jgi:FMN phosphatase YigB (HAD superfamily)